MLRWYHLRLEADYRFLAASWKVASSKVFSNNGLNLPQSKVDTTESRNGQNLKREPEEKASVS